MKFFLLILASFLSILIYFLLTINQMSHQYQILIHYLHIFFHPSAIMLFQNLNQFSSHLFNHNYIHLYINHFDQEIDKEINLYYLITKISIKININDEMVLLRNDHSHSNYYFCNIYHYKFNHNAKILIYRLNNYHYQSVMRSIKNHLRFPNCHCYNVC